MKNDPSPKILPDSLPDFPSEITPDLPQDSTQTGPSETDPGSISDEDTQRMKLQEFFNLDPDTDQGQIAINTFLVECKAAKYAYFNQSIAAYSVHQPNLDDMLASDFDKKSIIPDEGIPSPKPAISHLSPSMQ